jgi:hypothetical protein
VNRYEFELRAGLLQETALEEKNSKRFTDPTGCFAAGRPRHEVTPLSFHDSNEPREVKVGHQEPQLAYSPAWVTLGEMLELAKPERYILSCPAAARERLVS